ncbi:hypothetical protein OIU74_014699 [Salix koriyanagi]|uniref:Phosphatidic acid phosphatase type 2/haloperoxidase domain-containing protein n=1 Tax=Salix koriyanagi TaxID=2511006 RepID=A0A9Q0PWD1_9ROSI|nr:hypothetical protein OIU74_014699 [Salix koriyanagi]
MALTLALPYTIWGLLSFVAVLLDAGGSFPSSMTPAVYVVIWSELMIDSCYTVNQALIIVRRIWAAIRQESTTFTSVTATATATAISTPLQLPQMAEPPPALIQKVLTVDTKFSHYLHSKFHTLLPIFFHLILEISADFRFSFPISFSLLFTLSLPSLLPFFSSLLLGLLLDLAAVGLIKILFRRPRPPYNHLSSMSTPVSADHFSFPSGHSSRVSFVAALVFLYKEAIEVAVCGGEGKRRSLWKLGGGGGKVGGRRGGGSLCLGSCYGNF